MPDILELIRLKLASGPLKSRQLADSIEVSQPTISRAMSRLGDEVFKLGNGPSIQYVIRDYTRGIGNVPVYRVDIHGKIRSLGTLVPVRPDGYLMVQEDGIILHNPSLPWWLYDMRPQGYLGRAYAKRHAHSLGLPVNLKEWNDAHALRALVAHGHDAVGNLLLGDIARDQFLSSPTPIPVSLNDRGIIYSRLAEEASRGEEPGSSAGGEQPKFTAYVETENGPQHVIVKFNASNQNPVSERWKDLLLAEHLALETLRQAGVYAPESNIVDSGNQRFLQVNRFDRIGEHGRNALFSLAALDAEFLGAGTGGWHSIASRLADLGVITQDAANGSALLYAFGRLIGNSDMHNGNISYISEHGQPYELAPAYDMLPMAFSPNTGGHLPNTLTDPNISGEISNDIWRQALKLALVYLDRIESNSEFNPDFIACITSLRGVIEAATLRINKLG
jgi:hypothetical protein